MMGRVVAAFASVMILLFGATVALGCRDCSHEAAQSQASTERLTEEVIAVDLAVDVEADLVAELRLVAAQDDTRGVELTSGAVEVDAVETITKMNGRRLCMEATGATGISHGVATSVIDYIDSVRQLGRRREVLVKRAPGVQLKRSPSDREDHGYRGHLGGRFTGAPA